MVDVGLGVYAATAHAVATEFKLLSHQAVSFVFFWNTFAAWLIVVIAGLLRTPRQSCAQHPSDTESAAGVRAHHGIRTRGGRSGLQVCRRAGSAR